MKNYLLSLSFKLMGRRLKKHFSEFIKDGDLVFDVGAHKGELTDIFLDLGARVVCIDPQPYCVRYLKEKYANHKMVTIVDKGLADKQGVLTFSISSHSPVNSTFSKEWQKHPRYKEREWDKNIKAKVTTLDKLFAEFGKPVFCKIDVEGFELKVLSGLSTPIQYLSFEFDQEFLTETSKCLKWLDKIGKASYKYSLYNFYTFKNNEWRSSAEILSELSNKVNGCLRGDIYVRFQ